MTMTIELSLLAHLDAQIASARKLLQLVLGQGTAVRERDAEAVLVRMSEIQAEMGRRATLELNRTSLLQDAGRALQRPAHEVTLDALCTLVPPSSSGSAHAPGARVPGAPCAPHGRRARRRLRAVDLQA